MLLFVQFLDTSSVMFVGTFFAGWSQYKSLRCVCVCVFFFSIFLFTRLVGNVRYCLETTFHG